MKAFFARYSIIVLWIIILGAVGTLFVLIAAPSLHLGSSGTGNGESSAPAPASSLPSIPAPSVSLTIVKQRSGNSLYVQWANLPGGTTALDIFRGTKNATSGWSLWQTLPLLPGDLASGNRSIALGRDTLAGYEFYVQAVSGTGTGAGNAGSGGGPSALWTPAIGTPSTATSPPSTSGGSPSTASGQNSANTATTTQTSGTPPPAPAPSSTSPAPAPSSSATTASSSGSPAAPPGTPYYDPQVQIQGYLPPQAGNFWVTHTGQGIELGWQDIPSSTTSVVVLRSLNENGPWSAVFTQNDPVTAGPYTIQIVDNTFGAPYYYEMNAVAGTATVAAYGPVYLAPAQ